MASQHRDTIPNITSSPTPTPTLIRLPAARSQQVKSQLLIQDSWSYYQNLLQQEKDIVTTRADIDAFRYGVVLLL